MKTDNSNYGLLEIEREGDTWSLLVDGIGDAAVVGTYLWPTTSLPDGVRIRFVIQQEGTRQASPGQPYQIGWYDLTGLSTAALSTMDPWCRHWFEELGGTATPNAARTPRPEDWVLVNRGTAVVAHHVLADLVQLQGELNEVTLDLDVDVDDAVIDVIVGKLGLPRPASTRDVVLGALIGSGLVSPAVAADGLAAVMGGWTVAFGLAADLGFGLGVSAGKGIYIGADGSVGSYESIAADAGTIAGIAGGLAVMAVKGGPDKLGGYAHAVTLSAGVGIFGGSGSLLFTMDGVPYGWAAELSVGIGSPIQAYEAISHTLLQQWVEPG